jgi:serine/threonine-protein kinase
VTDDKTRIATRSSGVSLGTELNQTYKIDSLIGVGGMGEVFKGHNIQTGDPVAIKIVLPEFARDEMILELFRKEARILNHLLHDAIVRYYVFSIDRDIGRPYLAMEYVDGPSLAERVKTARLTPDDFTYLLKRLADGLHTAHAAGVIHRDMSPDNVILPGGLVKNAKIIDFGIARSANVGGATLLGGSFAGKYNYVSPEQLGLYGGEVTPQSDIYSLALVMIAALRGQPLNMSGSQVEVIEKRRRVPDLTGVPKQFHAVLAAMLQPDPGQRLPNMAAVRDWKDEDPTERVEAKSKSRVADEKKIAAQSPRATPAPASVAGGAVQPSRSVRNTAVAAGLVSVIAIGALAGWIFVRGSSPPEVKSVVVQKPATEPLPAAPAPAESQVTATEPPVPPSSPPAAESPAAESAPPVTAPGEPATPPPPANVLANSPPTVEATLPPPVAASPAPTPALPTPETKITETQAAAPPAVPAAKPEAAPAVKTQSAPVILPKPEVKTPPAVTKQPEVAMVVPPKAPPPAATPAKPSVLEIDQFVRNFGAGSCIHAEAAKVSATSADINVLATEAATASFQQAFTSKAGFAPNLVQHQVSEEQCQLVSALKQMSSPNAAPITITVDRGEFRGSSEAKNFPGDTLYVQVKGDNQRNVYVFYADYMGGIHNINRECGQCIMVKPGETDVPLRLEVPALMDGETPPAYYPLLLFAIASPKPLISVNAQSVFDSADFLDAYLKEIATAPEISTQVAYAKMLNP